MSRRYSIGHEWRSVRGQWFVYLPEHPMARRDGFVPRARLVMAEFLGRNLTTEERVFHMDENPENDDPENLQLFPSQKALAQHRSELYHKGRKAGSNPTWEKMSEKAREMRQRREEDRVDTPTNAKGSGSSRRKSG